MKKTIIAMLALSGVAFGVTTKDVLNENLAAYIKQSGYQYGDAFTLTLKTTVSTGQDGTGETGSMVYLSEEKNWSIWMQQSNFLGVTNTNSDPGNWNMVDGSKQDPYTGNLTVGDKGWLVQCGSAQNNSITNICFTITSGIFLPGTEYETAYTTLGIDNQADTTWVNSSIVDADGVGVALDLNDIKVDWTLFEAELKVNDVTYNLTQAAPAIPEPTTATLSLLALAGLAARRRRK